MKRNLPAIQQNSLVRVKNNLDILNKLIGSQTQLLDSSYRKRIIDLMSKHQDFSVNWFLRNYGSYEAHRIQIKINPNLFFRLKKRFKLIIIFSYNYVNWTPDDILSNITEIRNELSQVHSPDPYCDEDCNKDIREDCCRYISDSCTWSEAFLKKHLNSLPWDILKHGNKINQTLYYLKLKPDNYYWEKPPIEFITIDFVSNHENELNWKYVTENCPIEILPQIIQNHYKLIDFYILSFRSDLTVELLSKYKTDLDWEILSEFGKFSWSAEFISKFANLWKWFYLSLRKDFPWTIELIEEFEDYWSWSFLSSNESLPWSDELMLHFKDKWDTTKWMGEMDYSDNYGSGIHNNNENSKIIWTIANIREFRNKINFKLLSTADNIPWSIELIKEYFNKWDWMILSENTWLPWSEELILTFAHKWLYKFLSWNRSVPWTISLINKIKVKLNNAYLNNQIFDDYFEQIKEINKYADWNILSENTKSKWSPDIIKNYKENWNWKELSYNESLPWSLDLIEKYEEKWNWKELSFNKSIPWTLDLIGKYEEKWDWEILSCNTSLPWSLDLIEKYEGKWDWKWLSFNKLLPWSLDLIEKYEEKWDWKAFLLPNTFYEDFRNKSIYTHSKVLDIIYPLLDDSIMKIILENIANEK